MNNRPGTHRRPRFRRDDPSAAVSSQTFSRRSRPRPRSNPRVNLDPENLKNGLAQLVLTLIKLLHELLEKQAIRRIESGHLEEADCERVGLALMRQNEQIEKLRLAFGLEREDLNIDLGPLGKLI